MKKLLIALLLLPTTLMSVANAGDFTIGTEFGKAYSHVQDHKNLEKDAGSFSIGWLSDSGTGLEVKHSKVSASTVNGSVPYGDGNIVTYDNIEDKMNTLAVVKQYSISNDSALLLKLGVSDVTVSTKVKTQLLPVNPSEYSPTSTVVSKSDYTALYSYVGAAYKLDGAILSVGVDYYKNGDLEIVMPVAGVRINF